MIDPLLVNDACAIDRAEFDWRFTPSGGPGGQHANRSSTRVELTFDVEASPSLTEAQRALVLAKLGPVVRIMVDEERSQLRNRTIAVERLGLRLAAALHQDPPRRPTRPGRGAKERRLEAKRIQSGRKQARNWSPGED